jgi:DNA-binding CsgD family transcriptional regulator/catechol 2,3-dioxygenase-like lactoylglutathione lyase family enzyme
MASRRRGRPPSPDVLTPSEWEVLNLVRHGVSRRQLARVRGTSLDAVKYHLANIAGKLGVRSRELRHWPGYPATSPLARRRSRPAMAATAAVHLGPIGQISLSIRSVESAERFYRDTLGLPHLFTFGDLVFFDAGGTRIYLHRKDEADWRPGSILYFLVDDIAVANRALKEKGVKFGGAPHLIYTDDETGIEEWMAFFEDGEGNTLALMARVTPS